MNNSNRYIGCCGAYCRTCKAFNEGFCKACKIGYDTGERDIVKAKCKIKLCCFGVKKMDTCADCNEIETCQIINIWYGKNGLKYQKYKQAINFIKEHGYPDFICIAEKWKNAFGKYNTK